VFLKESKNHWRYAGRFEVDSFVTDTAELLRAKAIYGSL